MSKKKTKIVIASVLKPVDDVRNYEKIGCSLAKLKDCEITMLGVASKKNSQNENIQFLPWRSFDRLSIGRLNVQLAFVKKLFILKPQLVIVTSHELLIMAVIGRLFVGYQLIYDVQEDYYKNLSHQHFYPWIIRKIMAVSIRCTEWLTRPFISHYLLAEEMYLNDLAFTKNKRTVIDNKSLAITNQSTQQFKVIFTGTISDYSKCLESIELYQKLKSSLPNPTLVVIGYCPSVNYLNQLKKKSRLDESIQLLILEKPVPHQEIVEHIASANLAIIGYECNPVNVFKIPTKQYEYTAARLPYLVRSDTYWSELGSTWGGAIPIEFTSPDVKIILEFLASFDPNSVKTADALWIKNEDILLKCVDSFINK
jgi:glycosyltransferase involved in cell wall biosynthesis